MGGLLGLHRAIVEERLNVKKYRKKGWISDWGPGKSKVES